MSHKDVFQLQTLDLIISSKVKQYNPKTILVLGAASGNGFGHFTAAKEVYAVDINPDFLNICRERYGATLKKLVMLNCDVNINPIPVKENYIGLVICHLFLEYVDLNKAFGEIKRVLKPGGVCNIIIQQNNNVPFVSDTGITSLNILEEIAKEVSEDDVEKSVNSFELKITGREEFTLPNGKMFVSFDIKK
jgi:ubiquinone/menaquinone biosynthesis C-methylase UbiE